MREKRGVGRFISPAQHGVIHRGLILSNFHFVAAMPGSQNVRYDIPPTA